MPCPRRAVLTCPTPLQYPMPESLARPVTNPEYYVRLGRILESAARGEKMNLSWTQRVRHFFGMKI